VGTSLSDYVLAVRTGAWVLSLPIRLRGRNLHRLVESLHRPAGPASQTPLDPGRAARIVARVCRLRLFDLPLFPGTCLRRSLALYHVLGRMGHPVAIHIGVRKDSGERFEGHSWVTLEEKTLLETNPLERFRAIFTYPRAQRPC